MYLFDLIPLIGMAALILLVPDILLLCVVHCMLEILLEPAGKNLHQAFSLDQLVHFKQ